MSPPVATDATSVALANFEVITADTATLADAERVVSPDHINHEAANEPLGCRQTRPARAPRHPRLAALRVRALRDRGPRRGRERSARRAPLRGDGPAHRRLRVLRRGGDVKDAFPATLREATMARRTGSRSSTAWPPRTAPTATTWAWPSSSAGCRPSRRSCSGWRSPSAASAARWRSARRPGESKRDSPSLDWPVVFRFCACSRRGAGRPRGR